jgi:mitochondrial fission protein ELM1
MACHTNLNLIPLVFFDFQIQHPRSRLDRFDLVVTPRHDYYALTASGQQEVPRLFRRWITPQEPPGRNVVCVSDITHKWKIMCCVAF